MKKWDTVAVIGVGLIGGSVGLDLRKRRLAKHVVGVGRRASSLQKAKRRGTVTATTTRLARGVADAELILVCTPVDDIVQKVMAVADHCPTDALITDVGSTKAEIVASLEGKLRGRDCAEFVGSHPLAGSEKAGPEHARTNLFEGRAVVVTPTRRTSSSATETIESFWKSLGARVISMTPKAHDQAVSTISHVPHLVASALAAATPVDDLQLAGGGWLDTTRVAGANAELWRQILCDNRAHVLKSLDKFEKVLASFRHALVTDDQRTLLQLLEAGKRNRDSVGN